MVLEPKRFTDGNEALPVPTRTSCARFCVITGQKCSHERGNFAGSYLNSNGVSDGKLSETYHDEKWFYV